ncbi:MAG: metallophosphoesterase family protein, partial [Promethearchaeota archaeon]
MFDLSHLPDSLIDFVVVSDTHYMLDPGSRNLEFESRRHQTSRTERTLQLIASIKPAFTIHLGDLVQEYPETIHFQQAVIEAHKQMTRCIVNPHIATGNHDVGDKPDPSMPTEWTTNESMNNYHRLHGRSWYCWNEGKIHLIVLNSQIMNAELTQSQEQRRWLESDL